MGPYRLGVFIHQRFNVFNKRRKLYEGLSVEVINFAHRLTPAQAEALIETSIMVTIGQSILVGVIFAKRLFNFTYQIGGRDQHGFGAVRFIQH